MAVDVARKTDTWGSKFGFLMAAVGSSVGLGNFWRFPYTAGENGGGAFILLYLLAVLLIGLPLLMAEYSMGRKSGHSAVEGVQSLARAEGKSQNWGVVGWVGTLTALMILTFYMVISVWLLSFLIQSLGGAFSGINADAQVLQDNIGASLSAVADQLSSLNAGATCDFITDGVITQPLDENNALRAFTGGDVSNCRFSGTISNAPTILLLLALFIAANVFVVGRGVKGGIEKVAVVLMPLFFLMLIVVVVMAAIHGDFAAAASFIFEADFSKVGFGTLLDAIGQAFFSIGVGVGLMITYGAYLRANENIPQSSGIVVGADTFVALIAGFALFPFVFAASLDPAGGPGLFFVVMPVAFDSIPAGGTVAIIFFALALFAAFTSSISLMEVGVSWLEERQGVTRIGAAIGVGFLLFMVGAGYVFSTAYLDFVDFMTEGVLLPLGGLLAAIFAGWILSRQMLESELGTGSVMNTWRFLIRWFVPAFVGFVLVFGFLDKIQDTYKVQLPGFLEAIVGDNAEIETAGEA